MNSCPNCHAELKESFLTSNNLLRNEEINVINEYTSEKHSGYCNKCGPGLLNTSDTKRLNEISECQKSVNELIDVLPIITIGLPLNWNYNVLGMVTAQSSTGTGVFSELASSVTDFFGTQSNALNAKLKGGEKHCFSILRKQALDLGGNAIIATNISYAEIGSGKGILMVCAAGTAVLLKDVLSVLNLEIAEKLIKLNKDYARFKYLSSLM